MKQEENKQAIIPVRFSKSDLEILRKEAGELRLSVAAVVRMKVARTLQEREVNQE